MESTRNNGSSVDMRTGPSTNSGEGEQFNKENKLVPSSPPFSSELTSEDFFDFVTNATTTTTHSDAKKGDGRPINSHLEAHSGNHFGEAHPSPLANNIAPSSSSQNPFLMMSDDASESEKVHDHLHSLAPSQGIPFEASTSATSKKTHVGAADLMNGDHGNESHHRLPSAEQGHWSMPSHEARTHPANTHAETHVSPSSQKFESAQNQQLHDAAATTTTTHHTFSVTEQGQHCSMASGKSSTQDHMHNSANAAATKAPPKGGNDFKLASESSDDDIPMSSFPKHGQQTSDSAGQYSSSALAPGTSNGSEKQNPPLQVMERSEDPTTSSKYRFPSHVFDRHKSKSNTQWSTASNESLFSIQMGNMSFSSDMAWMSKSSDMDKPGDMNSSAAFPSNQPPLPPQHQPSATKFNDISQSTAKQHQGSRVTEEKAAETMREVIMENSIKRESTGIGDLKTAGGAICSHRRSNSNNLSHRSDGSTKSFAFNVMTDGDKTLSSNHGEEKRKQQKQPEQQSFKATPDPAQTPKPTPNACQNKSWLSCFPCC